MRILMEGLHGSTTDGHSLRGFLLSLVVCCWLLDGHGHGSVGCYYPLSLPLSLCLVSAAVAAARDEGVNRSPRTRKKK